MQSEAKQGSCFSVGNFRNSKKNWMFDNFVGLGPKELMTQKR